MKKAYKIVYNEDADKFDYIEFAVRNEWDFTNDPESNLFGEDDCHTCDFQSISDSVESLNAELQSGIIEIRKCADCGIYFVMDNNEKEWFDIRDLKYPKRCKTCRENRKLWREVQACSRIRRKA